MPQSRIYGQSSSCIIESTNRTTTSLVILYTEIQKTDVNEPMWSWNGFCADQKFAIGRHCSPLHKIAFYTKRLQKPYSALWQFAGAQALRSTVDRHAVKTRYLKTNERMEVSRVEPTAWGTSIARTLPCLRQAS